MVDEQVNNISKHVTHTFSWLSKLYGNDTLLDVRDDDTESRSS